MKSTQDLLNSLKRGGLLLIQDKSFPNVVTHFTHESLSSSWWSHPQSMEIFSNLRAIASHPDVLLAKLIDGKVTIIHRRLWKALLAVAMARDPWQLKGLSTQAKALLKRVEGEGTVVTSGPAAKQLERRLLVHGEQIHTPSGKHETRLESWPAWSRRSGCDEPGSAPAGRAELEAAVRDLGGVVESLPWHQTKPTRLKRRPRSKP